MIISKFHLFEIMQSAFSNHHPKFPFPKRQDLVDQTPEFQAAFEEFSAHVQAIAEEELIEGRKIEIRHAEKNTLRLEQQLKTAHRWNLATAVLLGAIVFPFISGIIIAVSTM